MKITNVSHKDFCPYTNSQHSIRVNYAEINRIGKTEPGYKRLDYSCELSSFCPYPDEDAYGRCPVYLTAPDEP